MRRRTRLYMCLVFGLPACAGTSCPSATNSSGYPKRTAWEQNTIDSGTALRPVFVTTEDIDGDSRLDVIAAYQGEGGSSPAVVVFFNIGGGAFTPVKIASGADLAGVTSLAVADLGKDGHADVVAACIGHIAYLRNSSTPRDGASWTLSLIDQSISTVPDSWNDISIGDFDGANGPDIVACNPSFGRWSWFKSPSDTIADGTGWLRTDIDNADRAGSISLAIVNFSGGIRADVVSVSEDRNTNPRIVWYRNPSNTTTTLDWTRFQIGNLTGAARLAIADLDGDGLTDVIVLSSTLKQVGWYKRPSDATTSWSGHVLAQFSTVTPIDVKAVYVDDNAQADIIVATQDRGLFRWFTPTPGKDQTAQWIENNVIDLSSSLNPIRFALGDIDGDNALDIIAPVQGADSSQDSIIWLKNPE